LEANRKERTTKENEQLTLTALILGSFFETESHFEGAERFFLRYQAVAARRVDPTRGRA